MSQRLAVLVLVAGSVILGACGDDSGDDDGTRDTGVPPAGDAQVDAAMDAAKPDSGVDASKPDATAADAKVDIDATGDAGPDADVDAAPDATVVDASGDAAQDAGDAVQTADAGDGATPDAGTVAVKPTAAGQIVITEFHASPAGDTSAEWVELYNPSETVTYDLKDCTYGDKPEDADYTFQTLQIPPKGYLTISAKAMTVDINGFVSDAVYGSESNLSSTTDAPTVVCNSVVIDTVEYSGPPAGMFPVPSAMAGRTVQLSNTKLTATDNNTGTNWCFSTVAYKTVDTVINYGSPKAANAACP